MQPDSSKIGGNGHSSVDPQPTWQQTLIAHFAGYWHNPISSLNSRSSVEELRRLVDQDLDTLETLTASFRSQRNHLSFPNRIPPEILARIFMFTLKIPTLPFGPQQELFTDSGLTHSGHPFPFTVVCRHWRDVSLHTPALWANITPQISSKWCREMFCRAQSVPLLVARKLDRDNVLDLSGYVPQLQHLALASCSSEIVRQAITRSSQASGFSLKSLLLVNDELDQRYDSDTEDPGFMLPADLFGGDCPALQRVSLRGMMLPWTSPLWGSRITHVEIMQSFYPSSPSVLQRTIEQPLQCLERMQALESLKLQWCIPPVPHVPHWLLDKLPTIDIPHLHTLSIQDRFSSCTYLLDRLRLPSLARLHVFLGFDLRFIELTSYYNALTSALTRHIYNLLADQPISTIQILDNHSDVEAKFWCQSDHDKVTLNRSETDGLSPAFHISAASGGDDDIVQFLGHLFHLLPLQNLDELGIGFNYQTPYASAIVARDERRSTWLAILDQCNHIRRLLLATRRNNTSLPILLGMLTADIGHGESAQTMAHDRRLCLPNLQDLIVDAGQFSESESGMSLEALIDMLVSQLAARRRLGARIHTLHVEVPRWDNFHPSLALLRNLPLDGTVSTVGLGRIAAAWRLPGYE